MSNKAGVQATFHGGFWKSDQDLLIVFHSNFLSGMHVSDTTRFYCKPDMTLSWFLRQGALHVISFDGFWKRDHDFLIALHSNFLSGSHGFRDNEVLLPTGNDVIVLSPLGGISYRFCWWNLKERLQFYYHVSLTYFAYLFILYRPIYTLQLTRLCYWVKWIKIFNNIYKLISFLN